MQDARCRIYFLSFLPLASCFLSNVHGDVQVDGIVVVSVTRGIGVPEDVGAPATVPGRRALTQAEDARFWIEGRAMADCAFLIPAHVDVGADEVAIGIRDEDLCILEGNTDGHRFAAQQKRFLGLYVDDGRDTPLFQRFGDGIGDGFGYVLVGVRPVSHAHQVCREEGDFQRYLIGCYYHPAFSRCDEAHVPRLPPAPRPLGATA